MKKLIAWGLVLFFAFVVACGRAPSEEYPDETPNNGISDIDESVYMPPYIPGFDHYDVSLTVDPVTRTVSGISRTTFTNRTGEPLETIVLRVYLNAFRQGATAAPYFGEFERRIFPRGREYGYMDIQYVTMNNEDLIYELTGTVLLVHPSEPLVPGETVQLVLQYNAYIPQIAHRTGANDHAMWFGMFLPVLAVHGEDGWQVHDYYPVGDPFVLHMASFDVEIITPANYIVAGTGVTTGETTLVEDDTRVTVFTASNARSFAFAISPYFNRERVTTVGGDIHLYYYTESLPVDEIMNIAIIIMEHLADRIGQYPFEHIRIVETDMFISGVAFSNMIFMDTNALMQPDARVLGQVLGQQWFANVVGSNHIQESWLDKGLARYVIACLLYDQPQDLWRHMSEERAIIAGREDLSLANSLETFDNWADYYSTHHRLGMLMFDDLNRRMGNELFWELVRQYFQAFHFQIATGEDFMSLAAEIYGESLDDFFERWFADVLSMPTGESGEDEGLIP